MSDSLIPIESVNALEIFKGENLDSLLAKVRQETATFVPDVSTDAGRKEIASLAYKVARSKTAIDDAGKELVAEWKKKSAEVDAARKKARDYLDALKIEVRQPLTDWEEEQARIQAEKIAEIERQRIAAEEARLAEIERREAEIRAREEAIRQQEEAERQRIAAEEAERQRLAHEEALRLAAEERAQREAAEALAAAERAAAAAEQARIDAEARAEREAAEAAEAAKRAAEQAARAQEEAVRQAEARAKAEAEERERQRLAEEARVRAEEERRAADREHRKAVNNAALSALVEEGVDEEVAKKVITLIASGSIPAVSIRY